MLRSGTPVSRKCVATGRFEREVERDDGGAVQARGTGQRSIVVARDGVCKGSEGVREEKRPRKRR